jgi:hypothetical protein
MTGCRDDIAADRATREEVAVDELIESWALPIAADFLLPQLAGAHGALFPRKSRRLSTSDGELGGVIRSSPLQTLALHTLPVRAGLDSAQVGFALTATS